MKIENGCYVLLEYSLRGEDGEVVESSADDGPMEYIHGLGELPQAIEDALDGKEKGFATTVTLPAGEAYGPYDPALLVSVPRDEFPEGSEIVPGDWIELEIEPEEGDDDMDGVQTMEAKVVDVNPDAISLDSNHPLAGQEVTFELRVISVQDSIPDEEEE
ncbi:MAG: peptidylprolyl isomerase [Planctomycetota bacterium]